MILFWAFSQFLLNMKLHQQGGSGLRAPVIFFLFADGKVFSGPMSHFSASKRALWKSCFLTKLKKPAIRFSSHIALFGPEKSDIVILLIK